MTENRPVQEELTPERIEEFLSCLREKGRGEGSLENYRRNLMCFYEYLPKTKTFDRETVTNWRSWMSEEKGLSGRTVNTRLSTVNSFLQFIGRREWKADDFVRMEEDIQPTLSRAEYLRLLSTARQSGKEKTYLLIKTLGGAGMRMQELPQLTVQALHTGSVRLESHNNVRERILHIPRVLQRELSDYARRQKIDDGPVFRGTDGQPLSRASIHHMLRMVSQTARISEEKATPRCLWKMYQATHDDILANIHILIEQSYERQLEEEQLMIGWDA